MARTADSKKVQEQAKTRVYLSQQDVPSMSLDKAMKVPLALAENFGYRAASPLQVAGALNVQPSSSGFRMLTGASIAYGLTQGGYNADQISVTPLGLRIVRPTEEGDDLAAKREALLKPRVIREFLERYDRAAMPRPDIGQNVLQELGVPVERSAEVFQMILDGADAVGLLHEIKGRRYVNLDNAVAAIPAIPANEEPEDPSAGIARIVPHASSAQSGTQAAESGSGSDPRIRKVFITHGKNQKLIDPIRKLLNFGELEAVVAVESQTVSQPVPAKVLGEMRTCGAAIIHVENERKLVDADGTQHVVLNENVLIEIGAAMALYGDRFILVTRDGVRLPSNLQGLLELRYKGETLDMEETVKLLEAINDMKKRRLP